MFATRFCYLALFGMLLLGVVLLTPAKQSYAQRTIVQLQPEPAPPAPEPAEPPTDAPVEPAKEKAPTKKAPEEEDVEPPKEEVEPLHPREIQLNLQDGSVITGRLSVAEITVKTEFGTLTVPVERIRSFKPGLDSYPEFGKRIAEMIENLGSEDYKTREETHKALVKMGPSVRRELERHKDDENAERKRHIQQILAVFQEQEEDEDDDFGEDSQDDAWIRQDTVVTTEFTMTGKISPSTFKIESKYGPLSVNLSDVRMAERETGAVPPAHRKVTVLGANIVQRSFKNSGLSVRRGDKITVRADGQIVMTPWGSNMMSSPEGGANFGWYIQNQIYGGALVAKIGGGGKVFKVGSRSTFVAKTSGTLQFAVAMQQQYAGQGYNFPGQYNVRVKVEPQGP